MKRIATLLMAVFISIVLLVGCSKNNSVTTENKGNKGQAAEESKIKVMASFYTMYDFAVNIGGDKVEVKNMVPSGIEPHDWEPAASDIADIEEADVLIYNGADLEHWVDTVLDTLENKNLITVEASKGISLIEGSEHSHIDEADYSEADVQVEVENHAEDDNINDEHVDEDNQVGEDSQGEEDVHEEHLDPHVWLSPVNAKIQVENIRDAFVKADPANEAYYNENYENYLVKLDALDKKYKDSLMSLVNKDIIVAHEAFGYLCETYGLNQIGIEGLSPDSDPDPARMEEIIEFAKEKQIKVIFFEELVSPKVSETIAKEIGATIEVLNPLEGLTKEQVEAGADYISVMEDNLDNLLIALQ
jgi:zinc transport system substrate-binding protein